MQTAGFPVASTILARISMKAGDFASSNSATRRQGAFGETLANYRSPMGPPLNLDVVLDDEPTRLDQDWECWAIFANRIRHIPGMPGTPEPIFPDDPDLLEVASIFRLPIETVEGYGHYYRP
ncbi:MAG TPA: hypothetical protein VFP05_19780 [Thermomicrobiales bacterium]|nr:hypothetical protein [Thermomicrobiales bacterium]